MTDEQIALYAKVRVALRTDIGLRVSRAATVDFRRAYMLAAIFPREAERSDELVLVGVVDDGPIPPVAIEHAIDLLRRGVETVLGEVGLYRFGPARATIDGVPVKLTGFKWSK